MRPLSQSIEGKMKLLVEFLKIPANNVAQLNVFEVMPTSFVPGIEIRSITRQCLQHDLAVGSRHIGRYFLATVDRRTIPNHQQPRTSHAKHMFQKCDAVQAVERLLPD